MKRIVAAGAAAALSFGLVIGGTATAEAKVKTKNVPTKAQIIKSFPAMSDGTFTVDKFKKIAVPGKTCAAPKAQKVKSGVANTGISAAGTELVVTGAAEFKSVAQAKTYLKKFKKFVKKCKTFTEPTTGATVTVKKAKAPKLGQDRVAISQITTVSIGDITSKGYSSSIIIRKGKRIAEVAVIDDAAIPSKNVNKLAKVATKKI